MDVFNYLLADTMHMNFIPAPTVVLPDAVVPSRNSAVTFCVVFMKSIYFCDSGNRKAAGADLLM